MNKQRMSVLVIGAWAMWIVLSTAAATDEPEAQQDTKGEAHAEAQSDVAAEAETEGEDEAQPSIDEPSSEEALWEEVESLIEELHDLRAALADARLEASNARRERDELRQFIEDHDQYGEAYDEFQAYLILKERELRMEQAREARKQHEAELERRRDAFTQAQQRRADARAERREQRRFEQAGFTHLGMNVYLGQSAYTYRTRDLLRTRVRYSPVIGHFLRPDFRNDVDFTEMIVSGSVVNAAEEVRNLGIAVTFFDENGNQVGHEIVQINNARPGVPYPFTSTIQMALDRPFSTSSAYVLFADPAGQGRASR